MNSANSQKTDMVAVSESSNIRKITLFRVVVIFSDSRKDRIREDVYAIESPPMK
jgi:hypothetical protein